MDLQSVCERISARFPVTAIPAHISNDHRWEFIGDIRKIRLTISPPHRIRLSETQGIIIYNWRMLSSKQQQECEHEALRVSDSRA